MRVFTLVSFGPITGPALELAFYLTLVVAKRLPLPSYLVGIQRKPELALDEIRLSTVLTVGDEGWDSENEYMDRQKADALFHLITPLKSPASNLYASIIVPGLQS